jgi:acetolactate synthase regulatory subunit
VNSRSVAIHRIELDVRSRDQALQRIVSVCGRRRAAIVALSYRRGHGDRDELTLELEASSDQAARIVRWLTNLVDVLDVRRLP